MRIACSHLMKSLATSASTVYTASADCRVDAEFGLEFLESILGCGKEDMYAEAASAYSAICGNVIASDKEWHMKVTRRILKGISDGGLFERQRGFALAAGVCGESVVSGEVVDVLRREVVNSSDVEVRRNSTLSLGRLPKSVSEKRFVDILHGLCAGMNDYATDERGDVGSWVREASMKSASQVIERIYSSNVWTTAAELEEPTTEALLQVLRGIVQQSCGRIDRTRTVAGSALTAMCKVLVVNASSAELTPVCEALADCFGITLHPDNPPKQHLVDFGHTESVFPAVRMALDIREVSEAVLTGLVAAGGGMGHQSDAALHSLVAHFAGITDTDAKVDRMRAISLLIQQGPPRLTIPSYIVLEALAKGNALDDVPPADLVAVVQTVRESWRGKLRDIRRTAASVSLLSELGALSVTGFRFNFDESTVGRACLEALAVVLGGPIPRLRRIAAESMYMLLIEFAGDELPYLEGEDETQSCATARDAVDLLLDAEWEMLDTLQARERRNLLCTLLHIRAPVPMKAGVVGKQR